MKFKTFLLAIIVAVFSIGVFTFEAQSADGVTPYFQVRMWTGYNKTSKEASGVGKADMDLSQDQPFTGGANMGMNGEANNVKGNVEVGFLPGTTGLHLRHLYATYSLGGVADLLVGRTWTPYTNLAANNVADDEVDAYDASTYDGRLPQIRLTFAKMFYIGLAQPTQGSNITGLSATYYDQTLPKLQVGVFVPAGPAVVAVHFVYQTTKIAKENAAVGSVPDGLDGKSITSMALPFSVKLNMAPLSINLGGYVLGKNMGDMGFTSWNDTKANSTGTAIKDNKSMGFKGDVTFDAGIGKLNVGVAWETAKDGSTGAKDDEMMSYYANFMYNLEKNFYIAPAWWRVDKKKDGAGTKQGTVDKFGLKFQANF
jgi:hypothetical protein